ncbi:MAG TPA: STAS domain-containing protein [Candidatus Sulfomarinibacteraceae bacterium]|nr:STAS domain-containing protein [Candidatus Sulfomarinibacteraceae bacterium]
MTVPVLKQHHFLIASVQSALTDDDMEDMQRRLVLRVGDDRIRGVIIDVTVVDVLDSYSSRTLRAIADMIRLRGAETVIVGIQPDVAFAMIQLGLTLEDIPTALDLEEGIRLLNARIRRHHHYGQ